MGSDRRRVGFLFTLDAMLAIGILVLAVVLFTQIRTDSTDPTPTQIVAQDVLLSFDALTLQEVESAHPWVIGLYNSTTLTQNDSVMYAIGLLWVLNDTRADNLSNIAASFVPSRMGLRLLVEGNVLFDTNSTTTNSTISVAQQQITGIDQGRPVAGTSSSAFLKKLRNKQTSSFAYFGGFVGQGNITVLLELPPDFNSSRIHELRAEMDTPQAFDLVVNSNGCGTYTPTQPNMTADSWNLTACMGFLQPGNNSFRLEFTSLTSAYVAGGFIKASYTTDFFTSLANLSQTRYDFPEVTGIVNIFDAFVVPQTLRNLSVYLHYESTDPSVLTFLTIGEKTVYSSNATGVVQVTLNDSDLIGAGLDYVFLSNRTVPIRFAAFNATTQVINGVGDADVVIVTDYSGSMRDEINSTNTGQTGDITDCENDVYTNPNIRRSHLARCLDQDVVYAIGNITGNRIYPVHFYNNNVYSYINPSDTAALISHYQTYTGSFPSDASGGTGLASALGEAYDIFQTHSQSNRSKFVIFMSDGIANYCARDWPPWWPPSCTDNNDDFHYWSTCGGSGTGTECNIGTGACQPAIDNTLVVAQDLYDDFNVTIHTVAFGPIDNCGAARQLLQDIASITNGSYFASSNISGLQDIYANISQTIINQLQLQSQTVQIPGAIIPSTLYGDSNIVAVHDPPVTVPLPNEIEVTRQTDQFGGCNPVVNIPSQLRVSDARVVSYSGAHWTDLVTVNGNTEFNLSDYLVQYSQLGDPYQINIPPGSLSTSNTFALRTGDSPTNSTGCSANNSMIYTGYVPSSTSRTAVYAVAEGCTWTIETEALTTQVVTVPGGYVGANTCFYTNASQSYNAQDAMQLAVYELLQSLDFDSDGRIFVSLTDEDLEIIITEVSSIPYLWGPIQVTAEVSQ